MPVTKHAGDGDCPYLVSDMAGNAREWTATATNTNGYSPSMTVRGGGFLANSELELWCAFKAQVTGAAKASIGFRVCYFCGLRPSQSQLIQPARSLTRTAIRSS